MAFIATAFTGMSLLLPLQWHLACNGAAVPTMISFLITVNEGVRTQRHESWLLRMSTDLQMKVCNCQHFTD